MRRSYRPRRPFYKGLIDGLVFLVFLALVTMALQRGGLLLPDTGRFMALDGDSLRQGDSEFRLYGIDAPELHQNCANRMGSDYPCGLEAKRALTRLVDGEELSCFTHDTDRYGRNVAVCRAGEVDINAELVRQGWALAYRRHSANYVVEEAEAEKAQRGIWQGGFEDPAQWRDAHRGELVRGDLWD